MEKLASEKSAAPSSTWNVSALHHSLPSDENPASLRPVFSETERHLMESGESTDSIPSSFSSSNMSSHPDQDASSQSSSSLLDSSSESRVTRDAATEILELLDQLETMVLATYSELQSMSSSEDGSSMLRITLEGFFFTHLWDSIISLYRCVVNV